MKAFSVIIEHGYPTMKVDIHVLKWLSSFDIVCKH